MSPNTLNRPVKGTKTLFVGNFGRERKYRLAWIHLYGINSLTFLAIRHKGEHNDSNWPILSCQLTAAPVSTHGDNTGQEIQPAWSILLG